MDKLPLHISKLEDINKTVEDIISLDKCKPELLKYAKDYHDLLLKNIKTIVFFPSIQKTIEQNFDSKNFTIKNAKDNISVLEKSVSKLDYIKTSFESYVNIKDNDLRIKTDLDNRTWTFQTKINNCAFSGIDQLYKETVDAYYHISNSKKDIENLRSKYDKLRQLFLSKNALLNIFVVCSKEINIIANSTNQNEEQIDPVLSTFSDKMTKLEEINNAIEKFKSLNSDDKRIFEGSVHNYFNALSGSVSFSSIEQYYQTTHTYLKAVVDKYNKLLHVRKNYSDVYKLLITNNKSMYILDYNGCVEDIKKINNELTINLNPSFENQIPKIDELENKIKNYTSIYSNDQNKYAHLSNLLNNNKSCFWVEDYDTLIARVNSLRNKNGSDLYQQIEMDIKKTGPIKYSIVDTFIKQNAFLLSATKQEDLVRNNYRNSFVMKKDFDLYTNKFLKNKEFKSFVLRVRNVMVNFGRFLNNKKTLKVIAIIAASGLVIFLTIRFWEIVLATVVIGGILFLVIKRKWKKHF